MKFKYFLRGLGTGIVFASIICLVAFQNSDANNISDKEIIERAKDLGLVEKNETVRDLFTLDNTSEADNSQKKENAEETVETKTVDNLSSSETIEQSKEKELTTGNQKKENNTAEKKSTKEKTTEKQATEGKTSETKTTEEKNTEKSTTEQNTTEVMNKKVTITIKGGSTSFPVCQKLQELGVIKDATDFDNYLIKNGYANRIRVGTHTLTIGMTYEEIAIAISDSM